MFHIFKHHDEWVTLYTHSVEGDDVLVLQVGEELGLSVEVCSAALAGLFQSLKRRQRHTDKGHAVRGIIRKSAHVVGGIQLLSDKCIDCLSELLSDLYLDCHMDLLLVWCQVVALSEKDLPKGSLPQLPLQYDVVSLDVLNNFNAK